MTLAMTMTNALIESKCQYHFRVHVVLDHKEPEPMLKMVYKETKLSVVSQILTPPRKIHNVCFKKTGTKRSSNTLLHFVPLFL